MKIHNINSTNKNQNPNFGSTRVQLMHLENLRYPNEKFFDSYSLNNKLAKVIDKELIKEDDAIELKKLIGYDDILLNNQEEVQLSRTIRCGNEYKIYAILKNLIQHATTLPNALIKETENQIISLKKQPLTQTELITRTIELRNKLIK